MGQAQAKWRPELAAMVALAIPVVLSELGWIAQGIVDTIMVGRLGPAAIRAVVLGNAVYFTPALFRALSSIRRNSLHIPFCVSVHPLRLRSPFDSQILGLQG